MDNFFSQEGLTNYFFDILLPLTLTFIFSWLVGFERKRVGKSAGISPHVIVSIAACAIAILQNRLYYQNSGDESQRLIAQVISGIGFLGAGVIIKSAGGVKGLTTASTIWGCAMMGLIFGMGFFDLGLTLGLFLVIFIYTRDFISKNKEKKLKQLKEENKEE